MDEMRKIYKELNITGEVEGYFDTSELNIPATFILSKGEGRILYKYAKRDFGKRAPGTEVMNTLAKLQEK